MTGPPRDWDKEMAEIDKIIAKQPVGTPAPAAKAAPAGAVQRAVTETAPVVRTRRTVLATWVQVLLGVTVAAGVTLAWPYAHSCGLSLYGYLAAATGVVLVGLWGAVASWARRMALAHLIALIVTLSGALLVAKIFLDRSSYPRQPSTWSCTAP